MRSFLRKLRAAWRRRLGRILGDALALHRRGEARSDGLSLVGFSMKLSVSWRARDIHPWDSDLPEERAAPRLRDQTLQDTEDAIERIFSAFPETDTLELRVLENDPASNRVIMSGLVVRSDLKRSTSPSIGMRLRLLGINYRLVNQQFEAVAIDTPPSQPTRRSQRDFQLGRPTAGLGQSANLAAKSRARWPDNERGRH
jgi:hypothetical protein